MGKIARFLTSSKWVIPCLGFPSSAPGSRYVEVIGILASLSLIRLGSSYSQYHWCASTFNEYSGFQVSSWRYSRRKEGIAKEISMPAGKRVHSVSKCWFSEKWRNVCLFFIRQI